jgi:hypothetical protein
VVEAEAVFVGGFTLEAVLAVCALDTARISSSEQADDGVVLEQLAHLLDKSLVQAQQDTGGEPRFTLLETIREYATEQLEASEEEAAVQQGHAHYFLRLAEEARPHLYGTERDIWLERLEREDANLRAALAWSKANQDAVEIGLRLTGALSWYWFLHDAVREGRAWLEEMLARTDGTDRSVARGRALLGGGVLAWAEDDFEAAQVALRHTREPTLRDVIDLHVHVAGAGRGHLVIGDSLVDGADEVRAAGAVAIGGLLYLPRLGALALRVAAT